MQKIKIRELQINLALLLFALIATLRYFIDDYLINNISLGLYLVILLLVTLNLQKRKISRYGNTYVFLCIYMFVPSLFNNAYIQDKIYSIFIYYFSTALFCSILFLGEPQRGNFEFVLRVFCVFAFITSVVTWISFFSPNTYINVFIPMLPKASQTEALNNFVRYSNRMGLTTHYSRNAFYILLGILGGTYFFMKEKKKKYLMGIVFFAATMLIVGKRGHALFFLAAFVIAYFIFYKIKVKTIMKFVGIFIVACFLLFLCLKIIPGADFLFNRIFDSSSFSSNTIGIRFEMYLDIINQFKNNNYFPIGWGQYARSTSYTHPGVHNDYIQLLCETGVIGLALVCGSNIAILIKTIKYINITGDIMGFIILIYNLFYLMYSMTGIPHYDIEVYMFYFLINSFLYFECKKEQGAVKRYRISLL